MAETGIVGTGWQEQGWQGQGGRDWVGLDGVGQSSSLPSPGFGYSFLDNCDLHLTIFDGLVEEGDAT
jgi:hypothetical protein